MFGPERAEKQRIDAVFERWIHDELDGFTAPAGAPRVFTYPIDESVETFERETYLDEGVLHPELWATHRLVQALLTGPLSTPDPTSADLCFLPLFLPVFESSGVALAETVDGLELLPLGLPHLVSSLWDGYPRPPSARANPFSMQGLGRQVEPAVLDTEWRWLDSRFRLFTLESSIDVHPNDICLTPLVLPGPRRTAGNELPLLYSFCGSTTYESVPEDHIRGVGNRHVWERLGSTAAPDAFVGTLAAARVRFGKEVTLRTLPARSRFTLCPAGWSRWSYRLVEAIDAGSIPVILSDYYIRPSSELLDWDAFSLHLPEEALPEIDGILRSLRPERVRSMEESLTRARASFGPRGLAERIVYALSRRH
jgi:hypothetical protein